MNAARASLWTAIVCAALLLPSTAAAYSTRMETDPVQARLESGDDAPVVADHDDGGTLLPGDDTIDLMQSVEYVGIAIDTGSETASSDPSWSQSADFRNARVYHDAWPLLTTADHAVDDGSPVDADDVFRFYAEREGWDYNYRLKFPGGEPFDTLGLDAWESQEYRKSYYWPFFWGTYDYFEFPWGTDVGDSDRLLWHAEDSYGRCKNLVVETLCPASARAFPSGDLYEATPRVRSLGYTIDRAEVALGRAIELERSGELARQAAAADSRPGGTHQEAELRPSDASTAQATLEPSSVRIEPTLLPGAELGGRSLPPDAAAGSPYRELFGLVSLSVLAQVLGALLYHRLRPESMLSCPLRHRMYAAIRTQPGLNTRELAGILGVHPTTVAYHGRLLKAYGYVEVARRGNETVYFENGGAFSEREKRQRMVLKSSTAVRVLEAVASSAPVPLALVAQRAGTTRQNAKWHVRQLEAAGLIKTRRSGRRLLIAPVEGGKPQRLPSEEAFS